MNDRVFIVFAEECKPFVVFALDEIGAIERFRNTFPDMEVLTILEGIPDPNNPT